MKNFKKYLAILLSFVMCSAIIIGCGGEKITPEESLRVLIDVNVFGKNSEMDKIGVSQGAFDTLTKSKLIAFKQSFLTSSKINEADVPKEQLDAFIDTVFKALGKSEIVVSNSKINGKDATVDVSVKGLDFTQVVNNTVKDVIALQAANPKISQTEYMQKFITAYANNIEKAPLVKEGKTMTVNMVQKGDYWDVSSAEEIKTIMSSLMVMN